MSTAEHIALWLIRLAAPPWTLFLMLYGLFYPWWRSSIGVAVFTSSLATVLLLNLSLLSLWLGPYPGHEWVAVGVFALVFAGGCLKLLALVRGARRRR